MVRFPIERIARELFGHVDLGRYSPEERTEIESAAFSRGRMELKALSRGWRRYQVDESLRERDGIDGKYSPRDGVVLSGYAHKNDYMRPEVLVHENTHNLLGKYDSASRKHPEDYAHKLVEMVLRRLIHDEDPGVRKQARKGYVSFLNRFLGNVYSLKDYDALEDEKQAA